MTLSKGDHGHKVRDLQQRLNLTGAKLTVDGWFGDATAQAVASFQAQQDLPPTGTAGSRTLALLSGAGRDKFIRQSQIVAAAISLAVSAPTLASVAQVESSGAGFFDCGRPAILFERHVFFRQLQAQDPQLATELAAKHPNICNPARGGYTGGSGEYQRFAIAYLLNPDAAICACSWGMFQIMGFHWQALGYESAQAFKLAMEASEGEQLDALVRFIRSDVLLHKALKARKWAEFAKRYNGPAYQENDYDTRLKRAFLRLQAFYPSKERDDADAA